MPGKRSPERSRGFSRRLAKFSRVTIDRARTTWAALLGVALIPVTWWLVGDLSSPGFAPEELDYMFRAPEAFERHATSAGLVGATVAIGCLLALVWIYSRSNADRHGLLLVLSLAATGAFIGFAARTLTAGGIGANIGAGFVIMIGVAALVAAGFTWRRDRPS